MSRAPEALTFSATAWQTAQTVTVQVTDDDSVELVLSVSNLAVNEQAQVQLHRAAEHAADGGCGYGGVQRERGRGTASRGVGGGGREGEADLQPRAGG